MLKFGTKIGFLGKLSSSRSDCGILAKIVTNCSSTRARLNKVGIIDSLACKCDGINSGY